VGLVNHALDERVALVRLFQFHKRRPVVCRVRRDVASQVGEELRLFGIGSTVEDAFRRSDMLLRFGLIPMSGSDAGARMLGQATTQALRRTRGASRASRARKLALFQTLHE